MPDINLVWHWATATLSPASVILFLVAIVAALGMWWFLKELRKADLRLVEASQQSLLRVKQELKEVKAEHRDDLRRLHDMALKQNQIEYQLKLAQTEIQHLKDLLTQANATIATLLASTSQNLGDLKNDR